MLDCINILDQLNDEQREAVSTVDGPLQIIAGAGSGKTRVLTHRIAYLIQQGHASLSSILAITFTNKAAQEMKERVAKLLKLQNTSILWIYTFHAFCARLLRKNSDQIGLPSNFSILDTVDQRALLKRLAKEAGIDTKMYAPQAIGAIISRAKNLLQAPKELLGEPSNPIERYAIELYPAYQRALAANAAVDFDDLLVKT
ncbi:MAG: helicase PcrA, partial [Bacillota bacterium]